MSDFKREVRYYVIKIKDLTEDQEIALCDLLSGLQIPCTDSVVVEKDWRNYEHTWKTIEQVASGAFTDPYVEIEGLNERISQQQSDNEQLRESVVELESCLDIATQILSDQGAVGSIMGRFRKALRDEAERAGGGEHV